MKRIVADIFDLQAVEDTLRVGVVGSSCLLHLCCSADDGYGSTLGGYRVVLIAAVAMHNRAPRRFVMAS